MTRCARRIGPLCAAGLAALLLAPTASADPLVPDPAPIPGPQPNSSPWGPLAQADIAAGPGGMPTGLPGAELVLGQNAIPQPPGSPEGAAVLPPSLNPWQNAYLLPQYEQPTAPGQGPVVGVLPGQEDAASSRLDYLRRLYTSYQDGAFTGALLGKHPDGTVPGDPLPPR